MIYKHHKEKVKIALAITNANPFSYLDFAHGVLGFWGFGV